MVPLGHGARVGPGAPGRGGQRSSCLPPPHGPGGLLILSHPLPLSFCCPSVSVSHAVSVSFPLCHGHPTCPSSLSLSELSFTVSLLLSLLLSPHILSCLWGTGNLGDQRDTGRLSWGHGLEIMHGACGGGAGAQSPLASLLPSSHLLSLPVRIQSSL